MALGPDPSGGIWIPIVARVWNRAERRQDAFPAAGVIQRAVERRGNEGASPPPPHPSVELGHEGVIEAYVQTHGHTLTHALAKPACIGRLKARRELT
jgi:hypothetical protein